MLWAWTLVDLRCYMRATFRRREAVLNHILESRTGNNRAASSGPLVTRLDTPGNIPVSAMRLFNEPMHGLTIHGKPSGNLT